MKLPHCRAMGLCCDLPLRRRRHLRSAQIGSRSRGANRLHPSKALGGDALQPPPPASGSGPAAPSPALPALSIASDCFANN